MRASLIIGQQRSLWRPKQQAGIVLPRIVKRKHRADRDLVQGRNRLMGRLLATPAKPVLNPDPDLPDDKGETGQNHELGEVPPGHVMILWPIDGEIVSPRRLLFLTPAVGRPGELLRIAFAHDSSSSF